MTHKPNKDSAIMSMTWAEFYEEVQRDVNIRKRCALLADFHSWFETFVEFRRMDKRKQKAVAGLYGDGSFGNMSVDGMFHSEVNKNSRHLSVALDAIPAFPVPVRHEQYAAYMQEFAAAFTDGKQRITSPSRLLAMKRPDTFVCLTSRNKAELCKDLGIKVSDMDDSRYWNIIECITTSVWWKSPRPDDALAAQVWDGRAAMLDSIFRSEPKPK